MKNDNEPLVSVHQFNVLKRGDGALVVINLPAQAAAELQKCMLQAEFDHADASLHTGAWKGVLSGLQACRLPAPRTKGEDS